MQKLAFSFFYLQMLATNCLTAVNSASEQQTAEIARGEPPQTIFETVVSKRPLDFLLPFVVTANLNDRLPTAVDIKTVFEPLSETRSGEPDKLYLLDFLIAENRLPCIGDKIKPWQYQGWLLSYIVLANAVHPAVVNRWGWWGACHLQGKLIEKPIPQLNFAPEFSQQTKNSFKVIDRCLEIIRQGGGSGWSSFTDFVDWLSWGCGTINNQPNLDEKTNQALYRQFNIEPFVIHPSDHLGQYLAEQRGNGFNPNAFYPTPHAVCELMAQINFSGFNNDALDARMLTVCDPAVGSGRQLMHASNFSVRLYGTDIDPLVVKICLINAAFYVPWMSFPFPEKWFAAHDSRKMTKPHETIRLTPEFNSQAMAKAILKKLKIK